MDGLERGVLEHDNHAREVPLNQQLVVPDMFLGDDPLVGELDCSTQIHEVA